MAFRSVRAASQFNFEKEAETTGRLVAPLKGGLGELSINGLLHLDDNRFTEMKTGIPFSGKSGKEFDKRWLPVAGLKRANVYVTNLSKRHIPTQQTSPVVQASPSLQPVPSATG